MNKYAGLAVLLLIGFLTLRGAAQNAAFDVTAYDAEIRPELTSRSVRGKVAVAFRALTENPAEITLNAGALEIERVGSGGDELAFEKSGALLKIRLARPLRKNAELTVTISYHGKPKYGVEFFPEKNQAYTIFSTSQWMPCVDAPDDRAVFRLTLIRPKNVTAAANGRLLGETALADGTVASRWEESNPVPTYLFGFAFGEFKDLRQRRGAVTLRYLADKSFSDDELLAIFRETGGMLDFYENKAGVRYPSKTYTQILAAGDAEQEMSGFTALNEDYGREVLKDEKALWLGAHEFAHQWWGNMVTNRDWTHFWLNEGLANFMTAAFFEHRFGRAAYLSEIDRYRQSYEKLRAAGRDKSLVFPDWNKPTRDDRHLVYDKGAYVAHLLREELGEEIFWRGFREYTRKNWGKSVETADFQRAMEKAAGRGLADFFDRWVYLKKS
ncbi:MAG: M1 family metallopeptidase [Acidobacteria bacterium]|nr:M1 family metallopeptidase [Acidobacteriota bacterium]